MTILGSKEGCQELIYGKMFFFKTNWKNNKKNIFNHVIAFEKARNVALAKLKHFKNLGEEALTHYNCTWTYMHTNFAQVC